MNEHAKFPLVAPSLSTSRSGATPAPTGVLPWPVGASEFTGGDENHPESVYERCHVNSEAGDLHAVPDFERACSVRFGSEDGQ